MMKYLHAERPAPSNIHALTTTRAGGISVPPYDSFNLGKHCGDNLESAEENRQTLVDQLNLPSHPLWLNQVHDNQVIHSRNHNRQIKADGCYTDSTQHVCAVLTADCLPIFICNKDGTEAAVLHGGWRSLAKGIIAQGVKQFKSPAKDLLVWLGPAIGPSTFQVGKEVRTVFQTYHSQTVQAFTYQPDEKRFLCDIYKLAKIYLNTLGITEIYGGNHCTYSQNDLLFSYRKNKKTGRMASLIWMD